MNNAHLGIMFTSSVLIPCDLCEDALSMKVHLDKIPTAIYKKLLNSKIKNLDLDTLKVIGKVGITSVNTDVLSNKSFAVEYELWCCKKCCIDIISEFYDMSEDEASSIIEQKSN